MTPHIEAQKGDYADTVLMPGDPLRAKWIAHTFLTDVRQINSVRNCLGFTGVYKGRNISVQGGGMGMPSNSIYITELFKFYDVQTIIRVGSCGAIQKSIKVGDIVAATTASTDSAMGKDLIPGFYYSPSCDFNLLKKFIDKCPDAHVGGITSNDYFYQPNKDWWRHCQKYNILAVEMETYMLYALAAEYNRKALSVNTVSDHLDPNWLDRKKLSSKQRETGFERMINCVLEL